MLDVAPKDVISCLNNHPDGPRLYAEGYRWYRTNSWLVGPFYLLPHADMLAFYGWYCALPDTSAPGGKYWHNDDTAINQWITETGRTCLHPLPTIIDHGHDDLVSTVGHGDEISVPRVLWGDESWRMRDTGYWEAKGGPANAPVLPLPTNTKGFGQ